MRDPPLRFCKNNLTCNFKLLFGRFLTTFAPIAIKNGITGAWGIMRVSSLAILTAAFAAMAGVSSASAADMAPRPYTKAPTLAPVYNWTGFYVGGNAGYSWGRSRTDTSYFNNTTGAAIVPAGGSITSSGFDMNGGIAGGQIGYNW